MYHLWLQPETDLNLYMDSVSCASLESILPIQISRRIRRMYSLYIPYTKNLLSSLDSRQLGGVTSYPSVPFFKAGFCFEILSLVAPSYCLSENSYCSEANSLQNENCPSEWSYVMKLEHLHLSQFCNLLWLIRNRSLI